VNDEAKKRNQNLPGQGGVFNYVNLHAYHYAGNNPVKYVDPDGKDSIQFFSKESYDRYFTGLIYGTIQGVAAAFGDLLGRTGNFILNIFSGKAKPALFMESSFGINGTLLNGTASFSTDEGIKFTTSANSLDDLSVAIQDLAGLPIKIKANGIEITDSVTSAGVEVNGDMATITIKFNSPNKIKGVDFSMGVKITASTQEGPFGTIENGNGATGAAARQFNYSYSSEHYKDSFLNE
jgi:hypothetical protein